MSFQGKVVIVTGASSGIGAATAIKFAEEGAQVCLVGRNQEKLNNVAKKCENSIALRADVSKDDDAKRIIEETIRKFDKIDILINNAGIGNPASFLEDNAMETFDQVMATNLRAVVFLSKLAAPYLVKTKGNIVNISSVAAKRVFVKGNFAYNTSKAALDHFTRSISSELAPSGVRVNVVNPGPVKTDIVENIGVEKSQVEATYKRMQKITSLNRVSEPEEVADLVLFLASDKAVGITGSSIVTDNGVLTKDTISIFE